jgi:hypothetical protein
MLYIFCKHFFIKQFHSPSSPSTWSYPRTAAGYGFHRIHYSQAEAGLPPGGLNTAASQKLAALDLWFLLGAF